MHTLPDVQSSAFERARHDDRGAILVLGIFMCTAIVGIIWYLAGIGDAIMYRERMQEAADAVAFSGAVLHARGMNLIVLLNLIMACILGIRVAMKVVQAAMIIIAAAFFWVPGVSEVALGVAEAMQTAINSTRGAIDNTLKALNGVQGAIQWITPPGALAGSIQVGTKYPTAVREAAAASPLTIASGLPVEDGSPDVLCEEAGESIIGVIKAVLSINSGLLDKAQGLFGKLVSAGGAYFCEIGSGGQPPDLSQFVNAGAGCNEQHQKLIEARDSADRDYEQACISYQAPCAPGGGSDAGVLTQAQTSDLATKLGTKTAADSAEANWSEDTCKQQQQDALNNTPAKVKLTSNSGSGNIFPKRVRTGQDPWKNGVNGAQLLSVAMGKLEWVQHDEVGVKIAEWRSSAQISTPKTADIAIAQAEFFYDCGFGSTGANAGVWDKDDKCNQAHESAMWHFRWRARLHRYNAPFSSSDNPAVRRVSEAALGADSYRQLLTLANSGGLNNSITAENALVLKDLGIALNFVTGDVVIH